MPSSRTETFLSTVVVAALTASGAVTLSGALTGTTGDFSGGIESHGTISGSTLVVGSGAIVGDTDGAGCSQLTVLNGTAAWETIACP